MSVLPSSSNARHVFNLSAGELARIEARMAPGPGPYSSFSGFLAKGERLIDVCTKDLKTLERLRISCDRLGDILQYVINRAKKTYQNLAEEQAQTADLTQSTYRIPVCIAGIIVHQKLRVKGIGLTTAEFQACPFSAQDDTCHRSCETYTIENLKIGRSVRVSALAIPLIKYHAFFGGSVPCRVDPELLCLVLDPKPDVGLQKQKIFVRQWKYLSVDYREEGALKKGVVERIFVIDEFARAYLTRQPSSDLFLTELEEDPLDWFNPHSTLLSEKSSAPPPLKASLYCHVFNRKERGPNFRPLIEGFPVDFPIMRAGTVTTFALDEYTRDMVIVNAQQGLAAASQVSIPSPSALCTPKTGPSKGAS